MNNNENETSKSIVTSYRLKEDTKENIRRQLDSLGLTQEQYFNKVVTMMELENVKQNSFLNKDTTIIQSNLDAILNAFIDIADSSNNLIGNKSTELDQLKSKYKDMLLNKDNIITEQKQELQRVYDNLNMLQIENDKNNNERMDIRLEFNKQLEQLESSLRDKKLILEEYKQKNDLLVNSLSELKEYKNINKTLEEQLELLKREHETLKDTNNKLTNANQSLNNKLTNDAEMIQFYKLNNTELKDNIKSLESSHNKQIENIKADYEKVLQGQEKAIKDKYDIELQKKDLEFQKLINEIEKLKAKEVKEETNIKRK